MSLVEFTLLVGAGSLGAGFLGSLTGLGGGVVLVPLLALGFGVDMRYAIGDGMRTIERIVGLTMATMLLAAAPAPATPARHSPTTPWTTADAAAAERVPGSILDTTLGDRGGRPVYTVEVQTADQRLEAVRVDARDARLLSVHEVADPGPVGEVEAP